MWESRVEIRDNSVMYFKHIAAIDASNKAIHLKPATKYTSVSTQHYHILASYPGPSDFSNEPGYEAISHNYIHKDV